VAQLKALGDEVKKASLAATQQLVRVRAQAGVPTAASAVAKKAASDKALAAIEAQVGTARTSLAALPKGGQTSGDASPKALKGASSGTDARTTSWDRMRYPWSPIGIPFQLEAGRAQVEQGGIRWSLELQSVAYGRLPGVKEEAAFVSISAVVQKGSNTRAMKAVFAFAGQSVHLGTIVDSAIDNGRLDGSKYLYTGADKRTARWKYDGKRFVPVGKTQLELDRCDLTQVDWKAFVADRNRAQGNGDEYDDLMAPRLADVSYGDHNHDNKPDALVETARATTVAMLMGTPELLVVTSDSKCRLKAAELAAPEPAPPAATAAPERRVSVGSIAIAKPGPGKRLAEGELALRYGKWAGHMLDNNVYGMSSAVPGLERAARALDPTFTDLDQNEGASTAAFSLPDGRTILIATNNWGGIGHGPIIAYDPQLDRAMVMNARNTNDYDEYDGLTIRGEPDTAMEAHLLAFARDLFAGNLEEP
jgi:hypothetical protein